MTGFKSFGDRTVTLRLSSGFTCIVGPNGAGKSNIIDALTFALGRLSKKTMRAKSLEDLIFAGSRGKTLQIELRLHYISITQRKSFQVEQKHLKLLEQFNEVGVEVIR